MNETIKRQVDQGATLIYSHGGATDAHMMNGGKMDVIGQMVELIKAQGVPAGVGGHSLNMPMACEKNKLNPDFYVKTFHWTATGRPRPRSGGRNTIGWQDRPRPRRQLTTTCGATIPRRRPPSWRRSISPGWRSR